MKFPHLKIASTVLMSCILAVMAAMPGCSPQPAEPTPDLSTPQVESPAKEADAAAPSQPVEETAPEPTPETEPVAELPLEIGLSSPKPVDGKVALAEGSPLVISGWCVFSTAVTPTVRFDGTDLDIQLVRRPDVEEKFPQYAEHTGFRASVPADSLVAGKTHTLEIVIDGEVRATNSFQIVAQ